MGTKNAEPVRDSEWRYRVLDYDFDASSKDNYIQARFKNALVHARKAYTCATCFGAIAPGELTRIEVVKMDGELLSARHCLLCCDAMASWPETDDMEQRFSLGWKRSKHQAAGRPDAR